MVETRNDLVARRALRILQERGVLTVVACVNGDKISRTPDEKEFILMVMDAVEEAHGQIFREETAGLIHEFCPDVVEIHIG